MVTQILNSPLGKLRLVSNGSALVAIEFESQFRDAPTHSPAKDDVLLKAVSQLQEYFAGKRRSFSLPLGARGTEFQQRVWGALSEIPYGEVRSYREIAILLGKEKAVRAVGAANGRNPLPIVVPCHRVIGSDGSLTGFAGGLEAKRTLLELEGALQVPR